MSADKPFEYNAMQMPEDRVHTLGPFDPVDHYPGLEEQRWQQAQRKNQRKRQGRPGMSDFRIIEATINPKRTDNLHDRVRPHIGQRMRLLHAWQIDEEEGPAEYVGQDAWYNPMIGMGWMPTEDLDDIEPFEGTIQQAFISPEQRSNTWREAYSKIARDLLKNQQPGEGAMKIQTLADSTITYGQEIVNGEVKPYRSHHVVSIKYADDGSLASRTETTTRTYAEDDEDQDES